MSLQITATAEFMELHARKLIDMDDVVAGTQIRVSLARDTFHPDESWQVWSGSVGRQIFKLNYPTTPNAHLYECVDSGTTDSGEPTWPTDGSTVVDNSVEWRDIGIAVTHDYPEFAGDVGDFRIGMPSDAISDWLPTTAYSVGDFITLPGARDRFAVCTTAGTSAGSEPTVLFSVGSSVVDGTVTWKCAGVLGNHPYLSELEILDDGDTVGYTGSVLLPNQSWFKRDRSRILDADDITWASSTISAAWATFWIDDVITDDEDSGKWFYPILGHGLLQNSRVNIESILGDFTLDFSGNGLLRLK